MANFLKNAILRVGADVKPLITALDKGKASVKSFKGSVTKDTAQAGKSMSDSFLWTKLKSVASIAAIGTALYKMGKAAITSAMNAIESENLFTVVMGSMGAKARAWSEELGKTLGLNAYTIRKNVAIFYNMTTAMGVARDKAYEISTGVTQLTYDLVSLYNIPFEEMFTKVQAGLSGEIEPLRRLGIIVSETATKQWAYKNGMAALGKELTETQKITARYGLLMELTKNAQGDLARTIKSPANQLKILGDQLKVLSIELGKAFMPLASIVLPLLVNFVKWLVLGAQAIANFMRVLFNYEDVQGDSTVSLGDAAAAQDDLADSIDKATEAAKRSLAPFDEINQLQQDMAETTPEDGSGETPGVETPTIPPVETTTFIESVAAAKAALEDFYNNWGMKDLVEGIRAGFANFDVKGFLDNMASIAGSITKIFTETAPSAQAVAKAFGGMLGAAIGGGISVALEVLDIAALGVRKFFDEHTPEIIKSINYINTNLADGLNNMRDTMNMTFTMIRESLERNKGPLSDAVSQIAGTLFHLSDLTGTLISDMFVDTTGNIKSFIVTNKTDMETAMDGVIEIYTKSIGLITTVTDDVTASTKTAWSTWGRDVFNDLQTVFGDIVAATTKFFNENFKPAMASGLDGITKEWEEHFPSISSQFNDFVSDMQKIYKTLYDNVIKPIADAIGTFLSPVITNAFTTISRHVGIVLSAIGGFLDGFMTVLRGVAGFVAGAFKGDWESAWNSIKNVSVGFTNAISSLITGLLNILINHVNSVIRGLNALFKALGTNWNIKELEKLDWRIKVDTLLPEPQKPGPTQFARGGIVTTPTLAMIGEQGRKEAVVPLENTSFVDTLAAAVGNAVGASMQISNVQQTGGASEVVIQIDSVKLARVLLPAMNKETSRVGTAILQGV
jgi:hypothetical protein